MKLSLSLFFILFSTTTQASSIFPEEFTAADKELDLEATGLLVKENGKPICHATRIASDRLISAAHCIDSVGMDGETLNWPLAFQSISEWKDKATLKFATDYHLGIVPMAADEPQDWSLVRPSDESEAVIFPYEERILVGDKIYIARVDLIFNLGFEVLSCKVMKIEENGLIHHSCDTEAGVSGAGILAKKGPNGALVLIGTHHSSWSGAHEYPLGSWVFDWLGLLKKSWNEIGQKQSH